jgi:ribokinase
VAFYQVCRSPAEVHLFTAIGNDEAGLEVEARLRGTRAKLHLARRNERHTRDVVMVSPDGERTIVVVGQPLHPRIDDPLPWGELAGFDAVYFTAQDPAILQAARAARLLVVTTRRKPALVQSGVRVDLALGSVNDARERSTLADFPVAPATLVMTEGAAGGSIETAQGTVRFEAPHGVIARGGAYGAGDSFAGALTVYLAAGFEVPEACRRAARHGAAVVRGLDPLENQCDFDLTNAS